MIITCPICKSEFISSTKKMYCSMDCYKKSDTFVEQMQKLREHNLNRPRPGPTIVKLNCQYCDKEYKLVKKRSKNSRFCSKSCWRKHYRDRFDRFIANPETIALPQNYDEFLSKEQLPCLFENCNWKGRHLGIHVNTAHGITAKEFRKLAGFNLKTGLVTSDISEKYRQIAIENNLGELGKPNLIHGRVGNYPSLEGKEHFAKAKAENDPGRRLIQTFEDNKNNLVTKNCNYCNKEFRISVMRRNKYCSKECKQLFTASRFGSNKSYKMNCRQCTLEFLGTYSQLKNKRKGKNVFCSEQCFRAYQIVHMSK